MNPKMKCPNCDGEMWVTDIVCPYCGWENKENAKLEQAVKIEVIEQATKDEYQRPEQAAQKTKKPVILLVVFVAVLLAAILLVLWIVNAPKKDKTDQSLLARKNALEELYEAKNYSEMYTLLMSYDDYYSSFFEKYQRIGEILDNLGWRKESLTETIRLLPGINEESVNFEDVGYNLTYILKPLRELYRLREEGYVYEEEEGAEYLIHDIETFLQEEVGFSMEEILEAMENYSNEDAVWKSFGEKIYHFAMKKAGKES